MSTTPDLVTYSASQLAQDLASDRIDSVSYCESLVELIQKHAHLNAFATFEADYLLNAAKRSDLDRKAGRSRGPLHGVPLIVKDNINTVELPTSGGTPALKGNRPQANAPIVEKLLAAGALIAGKANLHELSSGGTSANHTFGMVHNPYDTTRTPGGSSGGTAAAIAARLVPAGLGTDTMGSVRVPASLCGLFGFRPTVGRYSADGIVPLTESFDTAGPLARSMDDILLLDSVLTQAPKPVPQRDLRTTTIGVAEELMAEASSNANDIIGHVLLTLEKAGVTLKPVQMETVRDLRRASAVDVMDVEFERVMQDYLKTHAPHVTIEFLAQSIASPSVKTFTTDRLARVFDPAVYEQSVTQGRRAYDQAWRGVFDENGIDAIAFPTTPDVALPSDQDDNVFQNEESVFSWFYFRNTGLASHARSPGISLPVGLTNTGLPVGLELDGLPGEDEQVLSVAQAIAAELEPLPAPAI